MSQSYFHGGLPGLRGEILPPERTHTPSTADYGAAHVCRRDRVYLTTDPDAALIFAAAAPSLKGGWVYEVIPVGDIEPDLDWNGEPGISVQARRARIKRVHRRLTYVERGRILAALEVTA